MQKNLRDHLRDHRIHHVPEEKKMENIINYSRSIRLDKTYASATSSSSSASAPTSTASAAGVRVSRAALLTFRSPGKVAVVAFWAWPVSITSTSAVTGSRRTVFVAVASLALSSPGEVVVLATDADPVPFTGFKRLVLSAKRLALSELIIVALELWLSAEAALVVIESVLIFVHRRKFGMKIKKKDKKMLGNFLLDWERYETIS